jgi:prepilin-type N-terminal cleavage/methylation domain-containing protein
MGDQMNFLLDLIKLSVQKILNRQTSKGFTIVELMVVVACIGILSAAAAPTLRDYFRSNSLKKAVYQLSGDLFRIKSQAIRSQANCNINFTLVPSSYTLSNPVRTVNLSDFIGNVVFTGNPDGSPDVFSTTIGFDTRGLSSPMATTQVYVTNVSNRIYRIQVSAAGGISIRFWNTATNTWVR